MEAVQTYDVRSLDRGEVLRYLGYAGQTLTEELDARIDAGMARCLEVARPRGCVRIFDVAERGERDGEPVISLAGCALELWGSSIAAHLDGAVAAAVLAVTAGMGVEAELRRLSLTDPVGQLVLDAAGSALVERAADAAEASVVTAAADRGLFCSSRFSPGYGDLPLATQAPLLATLDAQRALGITLSADYLMSPTKSVTAVVGLLTAPREGIRASCAACPCCDFCVLRASGRTCGAPRA